MSSLPNSVKQLLQNGKFLHLGTSYNDFPHVSLMNYLYLDTNEATPYESDPCIVISSPKNTTKYDNISHNSKVSVLIHDWTTTNALGVLGGSGVNGNGSTERASHTRSGSGVEESHLYNLLQSINQAEFSNLSVTLSGEATVISDEDKEKNEFFKNRLLNLNGDAKVFLDCDNSAIILIKIKSARVVDKENNVSNWN